MSAMLPKHTHKRQRRLKTETMHAVTSKTLVSETLTAVLQRHLLGCDNIALATENSSRIFL
jgi:ribonuclease PH